MIPLDHTILLVEDNEDDILLIQRAFRRANLTNPLQVVRDGDQAIAYLGGEGQFHDRAAFPLPLLVLLDLKLPRRSGHEVLAWMRAQAGLRRIPVVVLTSSQEQIDVNRVYDLGGNSYLVKPVEFEALIEMARRLNLYWVLTNHSAAAESTS